MKKEFIPYEQALELKELSFDEPCFSIYKTSGELIFTEFYEYNKLQKCSEKSHIGSDWLSLKCYAPLYQQAFRWFREKYEYEISIHKLIEEDGYMASIRWEGVEDIFTQVEGNTYEEAELECLKKLIEICKK